MPPTTGIALLIIVLFVIPGFLTDSVYGFSTTRAKREVPDAFLSYIFWSLVNGAPISVITILLLSDVLRVGWRQYLITNSRLVAAATILSLFVLPVLIALIAVKLSQWNAVRRFMLRAFGLRLGQPPKAWDKVFAANVPFQALITLTDGTRIGGGWGEDSFASAFPADEDLFLEVEFTVDPDGRLLSPVERSGGILLKHSEIRSIQIYRPEEEGDEKEVHDEQESFDASALRPVLGTEDRGGETKPLST